MSTIDFRHLSRQQRLDLIGELCESLDSDDVPVTAAQAAELARRVATADADLVESIPWERLRDEIARRHA